MVNITEGMAGCWLDGHHGWHNIYRVIEIAQSYGFQVDDEDEAFIADWKRWRGGDMTAEEDKNFEDGYPEAMNDLSDAATDYLDSLAPDGMAFEWDMGELTLRCLCQVEGSEENALLGANKSQCDKCAERERF